MQYPTRPGGPGGGVGEAIVVGEGQDAGTGGVVVGAVGVGWAEGTAVIRDKTVAFVGINLTHSNR
jgi:hypothetical protein